MVCAGCSHPARSAQPVRGPAGTIAMVTVPGDVNGIHQWQWQAPDESAQLQGTWQQCHRASWQWLRQRSPRALPNLPLPTLGGKQFWRDLVIRQGWRLQQHVHTGHHRLLDQRDWRRAWGSRAACTVAMERWVPSYDTNNEDQLWILPGIWRSKDAMAKIADDARLAGWTVRAINYPSPFTDLADHAAQVQHLMAQAPTKGRRVVLTHSLGGLVTRTLCGRNDAPRIDHIIMIFPPNQGAHKANVWQHKWWYRLAMGPAGQQLTTAVAAQLPQPSCPVSIIAGGQSDEHGRSTMIPGDDDGTVAVSETILPQMAHHVILPVGHTFGMNDLALRSQVAHWLLTIPRPSPNNS